MFYFIVLGFEESKIVAKVPCSWPWNPSYMHSFGVTDNYFIVVEQPLTISVKTMLTKPFFNVGFSDTFRWKETPVCLQNSL